MKNDARAHDCPVCRALDQAQENGQDISLVELKVAFKSSRDDLDDEMDWVNDTPEE